MKASQISILREELHTCLLCDGRDKDGLKLSFDEEWKLRLVALYRHRQKYEDKKEKQKYRKKIRGRMQASFQGVKDTKQYLQVPLRLVLL